MKTIMITGASRGIGRAAAERLAAASSAVDCIVVLARKSDRFQDMLASIKEVAGETTIFPIEADLDDVEVVDDVFATLKDNGIKLNVIVNNAGYTKPASINETSMLDFEKTMRINVYAPFRIIQEALRHNHPLTQVINIASTAGISGRAGWLSYSASKAAMINMSEVMREELKPYGIEVISLSPGRCATDLRATLAPDEDPSTIMQPEQVAEIIELMTTETGMLLHSQNLVVRT